jgi:hypothetical protein
LKDHTNIWRSKRERKKRKTRWEKKAHILFKLPTRCAKEMHLYNKKKGRKEKKKGGGEGRLGHSPNEGEKTKRRERERVSRASHIYKQNPLHKCHFTMPS